MSMMCSIHGKSRTIGNLEDDGMGGFKCKDMYKCNMGGGGGGGGGTGEGAMCSVHQKFRTTANLMLDGFGGMCCKPGNQCQVASKTPDDEFAKTGRFTPRVPCKYYLSGRCTKGEMCTFLHEGTPEVSALGDWGGVGGLADGWVDNLQNKTLPGDWQCPGCNDHQFAKNDTCRKCGHAKPEGAGAPKGAPKGAGKGKGKTTGMGAAMDMLWNKFLADMGMGGKAGAFGKAGGKGGADGGKGKGKDGVQVGGWVDNLQNKIMSGDWYCPGCNDHQFAKNTTCRKCGHARPEGAGLQTSLPGDWICEGCGDLQFARNAECRKCGQPKPLDVAPGPY